jgi:hypothetical protein
MLCPKIFITAKIIVKPVYAKTIIGKYLLTFSAIAIILTSCFSRPDLGLGALPITMATA